jgi:toxin secretion/phage lysis holin
MDKILYYLTGGLFSSIGFFMGGMDQLLSAFLVFMLADYITGMLAAASKGKLSSKQGLKGVAKKVGMLFFIIIAVQMDLITGQGDVMRNAVLLFLVGVEGISILENLGELGLPIPAVIKNTLERFRDHREDEKDRIEIKEKVREDVREVRNEEMKEEEIRKEEIKNELK